jgi:hypothetical protein
VPDDRIRAALRAVGVDGIVERSAGSTWARSDTLSLDEQRLVGAARVRLPRHTSR